jgi:putative transposase
MLGGFPAQALLMTYQVEQHQIKPSHQWWDYCEQVCFASKNLFNTAQYTNRQSYIYGHGIVTQAAMDKLFRDDLNYQLLPAKVSQLVLMQVADTWKSYFKSLKAYSLDPSKFTGKPKAPSYIESDGRNIIKFNHQAISKRKLLLNGIISPSQSPIEIPILPGLTFDSIVEVRIVPKIGCYVVEIVFNDRHQQHGSVLGVADPRHLPYQQNPNLWATGRVPRPVGDPPIQLGAAIDIGIDNLATIVFSDPTIQPLAINGKPLKAENQWMNKEVARLRSILSWSGAPPSKDGTSQKIQNIIRNRNNFVHTYLHQATAKIAGQLQKLGVTDLAIGKNPQWKNQVHMGAKNNQSFVQIPHAKFISMLTQKLERIGITVKVGEESYTSKASFLNWDIIPTWTPGKANTIKFSGKRVATKKYRANDGTIIHADINGAFNIARKVLPNLFDSIESMIERNSGCVVAHPRRVIV